MARGVISWLAALVDLPLMYEHMPCMAIYALEPVCSSHLNTWTRSILQFCAQPSWAVSTALSRGVATQDDAHVLQAALLH
ncbi:hypothetical protein OH76DRAFT_1396528 [Lentinus brumalis]|uniref:Uncharacterized protein n=1 Tax=Lentinus brumalis TaxID=2498619 RepID=A0A371DUK3_9APHY|nr:hypothetical protein OH76DRAFT_1396528 [Polyporus brumalis]